MYQLRRRCYAPLAGSTFGCFARCSGPVIQALKPRPPANGHQNIQYFVQPVLAQTASSNDILDYLAERGKTTHNGPWGLPSRVQKRTLG